MRRPTVLSLPFKLAFSVHNLISSKATASSFSSVDYVVCLHAKCHFTECRGANTTAYCSDEFDRNCF